MRRTGFWIVLACALAYCAWLGWHWLPLGYSDHELAASASRVWDIQQEWRTHGTLPWWTPNFMSGSSYGLNYARGFHLVPWLALAPFFNLAVAGKLMALIAIFAGGLGMYGCARYFLKHDGAATLAALAFLLHPEQLTRAATQEHMPIISFIPFVPLVWWTFARALDDGRWRHVLVCALVVVFAMWADVKQLVVQGVFLTGYLVWWCWPRRAEIRAALLTCAKITGAALALGAFIIVPGLVEQPHIKLFEGDPIAAWQRNYSLHSPFALVDRNAAVTRLAADGLRQAIQTGAVQVRSEEEAKLLRAKIDEIMGLQMDSPEKYAGLVLLALVVVAALFNRRRQDRRLFWFAVGMLLLAVLLACGPRNVWSASVTVFGALLQMPGVPANVHLAVVATLAVVGAGLVLFVVRKKPDTRARWIVAGILVAFLVVPGFRWLATLPYFKEIRAPGVFYALPFAFFSALLAGFFVTDVLRSRILPCVAGVSVLLLLDFWPYQHAMKDNGVPTRTLQNLQTTHTALRADPDWVKTYTITSRYFHLLGPMWSGKPQVYEAFYNWMAPLGMGLLNQHASPELFNLVGARYVLVDKTAPGMDPRTADGFRQTYKDVAIENDDFVVFRNPNARPYLTGYAKACAFVGDVRQSARVALILSTRDWPLVHTDAADLGPYERVYRDEYNFAPPAATGQPVPLSNVTLTRERAGLIRLRATAPASCWAVVAESWYPFWRAELDGQPVKLWRVSCGLMGVQWPTGAHEVVLRYEPPRSYLVAGILSALAALAALGAIVTGLVRKQTSRS